MAQGWEHMAHKDMLRDLGLYCLCGEEAEGQTCN